MGPAPIETNPGRRPEKTLKTPRTNSAPLALCPLERSLAVGVLGAATLPAPAVHPRPAALSPGRLCGP